MIYYLLFVLNSAAQSVQECDWDYGIPGEHNKFSEGDVRRNLIVDGAQSQPHEYPWQVSIEPIGCGGSIISRQYVLSAAHCISGRTTTVVAGLNRYRIRGTWIGHEQYDDSNVLNDIAVIRLDEPLPCDDPTINAIALPELAPGFSIDECTAWVTGFGSLESDGAYPPGYEMHEVQTKVWSTETCNNSPENVFRLPETQLCGFTPGKPTEDSCQGDSGGPFKIDINADSKAYHEYVQVGIVSYGAGCGRTAGVYTDLTHPSYKTWILGKDPNAVFKTVSTCDKRSYHEGIVDCEGTNCRLVMPYCEADSSTWRSDSNDRCSSYSPRTFDCFSDKGDNLFASQVCPQCGYCRQGQDTDTEVILTNEDECSGGTHAVEIGITTSLWAKEISFTIGETCSGSNFANHANYTSTCCLPAGDVVVTCRDAYGDGWHGAQLLIDGELKCGEFEAETHVDSFFVAADAEGSTASSGSGGAIAAAIVVPLVFILLAAFCWCYVWPEYGPKDGCDECFKTYDLESKTPLSPNVKSEFAYPAPVAPASGTSRQRGSSYWSSFHKGPQPSASAFPQAPSIADQFKAIGTPPPTYPESNTTWHYTGSDGSDHGPISDAEFKSKIGTQITEETYVWNGESVTDWTYAKDVSELKSFFIKKNSFKPRVPAIIKWHYVDAAGGDVGPVVDRIFKAKIGKDIKEDTYVWNGESVTDWTPAKDVPELKNLFKPQPPARRLPPKSRFTGRSTNNTFVSRPSPVSRKAAFATKRQAPKGGVASLFSRFNQ